MEKQDPKTSSKSENPHKMRIITLEEHFATSAFMEGPGQQLKGLAQAAQAHPQMPASMSRFIDPSQLIDQLMDIDDRRVAVMDAAGIDVQVLSLTSPGVEQLDSIKAVEIARDANDRLADAVQRHPSRFAGLAALPTAAPDIAADELERRS